MTANKNKWEPILYSGIGVVAMLLILVAVGVISNSFKARVDLTEDKIYTLSEGTREILAKIDTPVQVNFYCTRSEREMPVTLKNYARRVEDLLDEYRQASPSGKLRVQKFDPQPDSEAEDAARLDGVEGQAISQGAMINLGEKVYLGLAVRCLDEKVAMPFLDPSRERLLEYDLTRAISRALHPEKPKLGVMSGLQVFGMMDPRMMQMGQSAGQQPPWIAIAELQKDFDVQEIAMTVEEIDEDINLLLVVHPSNISDTAQYAIDQFVLRGGKLLAMLDPMSIVDSRNSMNMQNMLQRAAQGGSNMEKLLKAWGLEFDTAKVVADKNYVTTISRGDNRASAEPTWLSLTSEAINRDDVTTTDIDSLLLAGAGAFTGTPAEGLEQEVLMRSSENSDLVDKMLAQLGGDTSRDFTPSGKQYTLGVRLSGKFKTAFPDGKPASATESSDEGDEEEDAADGSLKESQTESVVVLIGDTDCVYDQFCVRVQNFFGQRMISPFNGNLNLLQNLTEQLAGDNSLISVRSRAVQNRPFTRVKEIQAEAEKKYLSKVKQLQEDLSDAQQKLNELQRGKSENERFIVSEEQQQEIQRFVKQEAQTKKDLKEVRKQLRKDVDSLETRLKWLNIAGMPFLVTVVGLTLAMVKRKKTAAK